MIDKGKIIGQFKSYLLETIEELETVINVIDPINNQDYTDFKVLNDYLHILANKLQTCSNVRELKDYIDLDMLFELWDGDILPYLTEEQYTTDSVKLFRDLSDEIERVECND